MGNPCIKMHFVGKGSNWGNREVPAQQGASPILIGSKCSGKPGVSLLAQRELSSAAALPAPSQGSSWCFLTVGMDRAKSLGHPAPGRGRREARGARQEQTPENPQPCLQLPRCWGSALGISPAPVAKGMERGLAPQGPPASTALQPQLCSGWKGPSAQLCFLLLLPLLLLPCSKSRTSPCHAPRARHVPAPTLGCRAGTPQTATPTKLWHC